jgi:hypothetical protein
MGIWVRTQDKSRLVVAHSIEYTIGHTYENQTQYNVCTWITNCLAFLLGTYATETRALEVIDAIQLHITNGSHGSYATTRENETQTAFGENVFQMPAE